MLQHRVDQSAQHLGRVPARCRFAFEQVGQAMRAELLAVRAAGVDDSVCEEQHTVTGFEVGLDNFRPARVPEESVESERCCGPRVDSGQGCPVPRPRGGNVAIAYAHRTRNR